MNPVRFAGIGSGLDLESLVTQLVSAERAGPNARINRVEARANNENRAFSSLSTSVTALTNAATAMQDKLATASMKATAPSDAGFTVSAGANAAAGSFSMTVSALASAQKLRSGAFDAEVGLGSGTLTLDVGGNAFSVDFAAAATPAEIAEAINAAADNTGVRATAINGASGTQLVFSTTATGAANTLQISSTGGDGGLDALRYSGDPMTDNLTQIAAAADAVIVVDGVQVTSASNRFESVMNGIDIDVSKADPDATTDVTVARDTAALSDAVKAFVSAYNDSRSVLGNLTRFDAATGSAGALQGDAAARGLSAAIRDSLNVSRPDSDIGTLSQLGLSTDKDGKLSFDAATFTSALATDPDAANALLGSAGVAGRIDARLSGYLGSEGLIKTRTDALDQRLERASADREALDRRLEQVEKRLRSQFAALDTLMSRLQSDGNFLAQQLGYRT